MLLLCAGAVSLLNIRVDAATGFFVDDVGRARTFHGVNAVEKLPPFLPKANGFDVMRTLSDQDARNLSSWGMNVVRLGVLWEAVVPTSDGQVNSTYLAHVQATITRLAAHNIYTIVDMHQDAVGARFCGEGFPDWAVRKALELSGFNESDPRTRFPKPFDWLIDRAPSGLPNSTQCQTHPFFGYYVTDAASAALRSIFGEPSLWADFAFFWKAVARALVNTPGVLGYELLNEPWLTDPFASDKKHLQPLYAALSTAIREVDNRSIVFYEPSVLSNPAGHASNLPVGGPGGVEYNDRQALAYHAYCFNNTLKILEPICDLAFAINWGAERRDRQGGGRFLTEFGAVGETPAELETLRTVLDAAQQRLQSWAYWSFKSFDDITTNQAPGREGFYRADGSLQLEKVRTLARPYAPAVAGNPTSAIFDDRQGSFTLRYTTTATAKGPTLIFKHDAFYFPRGFEVEINPPAGATWSVPSANMLLVQHCALLPEGSSLQIVVRQNATDPRGGGPRGPAEADGTAPGRALRRDSREAQSESPGQRKARKAPPVG
jgi:endoglycosylceramidase